MSDPQFVIKDNVIIGKKDAVETRSVCKLLFDSMSEAADCIGLIDTDTDEKVTYRQMKDRIVRCAVWLKKQGITKDDIISISTPNQMHDYIPYFATFFVNAISSTWHYKFTKASAKYYLDLMKPKVVFACEQSIEALDEVAEDLNIDCKFVVFGEHPKFESLEDILAQQTQEEVDKFAYIESEDPKNQVGLMLFTSGTTGNPKAVMISYQSLAWSTAIQKNCVLMWYVSLLWVSGAMFTLVCAYMQGTRLVHGEFNPEKTATVMEKYKVNVAFFASRGLIAMCKENIFQSKRFDFSSLFKLVMGGSFVSEAVFKEVQDALSRTLVSNVYGQTEILGAISVVSRNRKKMTPVGHVTNGVQVKVVDVKTGEALGPNENGEICFKSNKMMLGYYKNPEGTKKAIDDQGWLHTGDLGNYDKNGEITIVSRMNDVVISQNFEIFLSEIEAILLQHPDVKDAAVISVPHEVDGQRPIAFVVRASHAKVTAEELQKMPAGYNKFYRITGGVVFVDHLPYTASEKVNASELKEWAKAFS